MHYKTQIWTNHALQRLSERQMSREAVSNAINYPDRVFENKQGGTEYQKKIGHQTIAAIVKENEAGERVILSCWANPPNPGTKDFKHKSRYKEMQKASPIKQLWLTILNQLGL